MNGSTFAIISMCLMVLLPMFIGFIAFIDYKNKHKPA